MIWERLKKLWELSTPKNPLPDNIAFGGFDDNFQPMTVKEARERAIFIPHEKVSPIKKITESA